MTWREITDILVEETEWIIREVIVLKNVKRGKQWVSKLNNSDEYEKGVNSGYQNWMILKNIEWGKELVSKITF